MGRRVMETKVLEKGSITLIAVWVLGVMTILLSILALMNQEGDRMLLASRRNFQLQLAAESVLQEEIGKLEREWRQADDANDAGCWVSRLQAASRFVEFDSFVRGDKQYTLQGRNEDGRLDLVATVRWLEEEQWGIRTAFSLECWVQADAANRRLKLWKIGM